MTVTATLGENYLWVDSLCIIQDDEKDMAEYIPAMASIYGDAVLTIIDVDGEEANHGLPGIRPGSRRLQPDCFEIKGTKLVQALDQPVASFPINSSRWASRGWTFQESILSSRRLMFTAEQVYWECNKAIWREDSFWESAEVPPIFRSRLDVGIDRQQLWDQDADSFDHVYGSLTLSLEFLMSSTASVIIASSGPCLNSTLEVL